MLESTHEIPEVHATYSITTEEYELLVRIIYLEGGTESLACKEAITSVIFNRLDSTKFADTIYDIIYAAGQFATATYVDTIVPYSCPEAPYYEKSKEFINRWNECYEALNYVLLNGSTLPAYVVYFRSDYFFSWATANT